MSKTTMTVTIDSELKKQFFIYCLKQDKTASEVVSELLKKEMEKGKE